MAEVSGHATLGGASMGTGELPRSFAASTLCEAFQITAAERPDAVALRTPGDRVEITWAEYAARVRAIAGRAGRARCRPGDTVALMLEPAGVQPRRHRGDAPRRDAVLGLQHLGARADQHLFRTPATGSSSPSAGSSPRPRGGRPEVEHIVLHRRRGAGHDGAGRAREPRRHGGFDFEAAWRAVAPEDVLTLIYTSGTTGPPKGVAADPRNVLAEAARCATAFPVPAGGRGMSYLPSAHIGDRWVRTTTTRRCARPAITVDHRSAAVVARAARGAADAFGRRAARLGEDQGGLEAAGGQRPGRRCPTRRRRACARSLGLDQCEWLRPAAAPIPTEVLQYLRDLGLPSARCWGMSELRASRRSTRSTRTGSARRQGAAGRRAEARRGRRDAGRAAPLV